MLRGWSSLVLGSVFAGALGCSSNSSTGSPDAAATCASPGQATPGPADTHCQGVPAQPVDSASCHPTNVDAGAPGSSCPYGATEYGNAGVDDDCKYRVAWTSDSICEGAGGVAFTLTLKSNVDGSPVTGLSGVDVEAFVPTTLDASCDDKSTHAAPTTPTLHETAAGSGVYKGSIAFDAPGEWTLRFHIHEDCEDLLPTSPHGHIAFHVTVP